MFYSEMNVFFLFCFVFVPNTEKVGLILLSLLSLENVWINVAI